MTINYGCIFKSSVHYFTPGAKNSLVEVSNPVGMNSFARYTTSGGSIISAEAFGNPDSELQFANFRVGTKDGIFPKIRLVDDVTTWLPGIKRRVTSVVVV